MRGLLFSLLVASTVFGQDVPTAIKRPITDEYHGVKVVDDYRWLEDGKSAETRAMGRGRECLLAALLPKCIGVALGVARHQESERKTRRQRK